MEDKNEDKVAYEAQEQKLVGILKEYLASAREAAREWQEKATPIWDMIHGRVDWSHKDDSMAKIHLNKVGLAHERGKAQFKKSMMNFDEWLTVQQEVGMETPLMSDAEAKRFVKVFIDDCNFRTKIAECIGNSMVENVCAAKLLPKVKETRNGKKVEIDLIPLTIRNYYFDPSGSNLFQFHEVEMDKYQLLKLASDKPTEAKPYLLDKYQLLKSASDKTTEVKPYLLDEVQELVPQAPQDDMLIQQDKGLDISQPKIKRRCNVVLHEFYGTILDDNGEIMKWKKLDGTEIELENIKCTLANNLCIIDEPRPIPSLAGKDPFVRAKLIHTAETQYGKSMLYSGYTINKAQDELLSAMTDAGMRTMLNIVQVRRSLLEDSSQLDDGLKYNETIFINDQATAADEAIRATPTGSLPQPIFQISGLLDREVAENIGMNEFQLSGGRTSVGSSATERVQSQQTFEGLFDGIAMDLEDTFFETLITKVFHEALGYAKYLEIDDLVYIFAGDEEKIRLFKAEARNPKRLFKQLGGNFRFRGKGIRGLMRNTRIAQSLTQLMSTLGGIPPLMDQAERSFSFEKTFKILLKGYGIDPDEVKLSEEEKQALVARQEAAQQAAMLAAQMSGQPQGQQGPANAPLPTGSDNLEPGNGAGQ